MARRRFFVGGFHNHRAELSDDDALHLTRVLRVERGQRFEVSDNQQVWLAEVTEAHKHRVVFSLVEPVPLTPVPVRITLLFSLVKFDRVEWILEKGTEIGVDTLIPVITARCEKGLENAAPKRYERWRRILLESSQQCRRDCLPVIAEQVSLAEALAVQAMLKIFLDEAPGAAPLLSRLPSTRTPRDHVALLVGPEGGWTDLERHQAIDAGWSSASLGPHVLRTETAATAAVSVILNAWWA